MHKFPCPSSLLGFQERCQTQKYRRVNPLLCKHSESRPAFSKTTFILKLLVCNLHLRYRQCGLELEHMIARDRSGSQSTLVTLSTSLHFINKGGLCITISP